MRRKRRVMKPVPVDSHGNRLKPGDVGITGWGADKIPVYRVMPAPAEQDYRP